MKLTIIKLPEGFEGPDKPLVEYEDGEKMEVLTEITKTKDGWKVSAVEGIPMSEEKEEVEEDEEAEAATLGDMAAAMIAPPTA